MIRRLISSGMGPKSVVHACKFKQLRGEGNKDQELKASLGYIIMEVPVLNQQLGKT